MLGLDQLQSVVAVGEQRTGSPVYKFPATLNRSPDKALQASVQKFDLGLC